MDDEQAALPPEVLEAAAAVFSPEDAEAERSVLAQMESMYQRDRAMAGAFVVLLLITVPFVAIALWPVMPGAATKALLVAAGTVLLTYNVASMLNLVRNYERDKDFIYRRDVAHLRELRVARQLERKA